MAEVESGIQMMRQRSAPDAKNYTEEILRGLESNVAEAQQFTVVQVTMHPDGAISVSTWRSKGEPKMSFHESGIYQLENAPNGNPDVIEGSTAWQKYTENLYGKALPPKVRKSLDDGKAKILGN